MSGLLAAGRRALTRLAVLALVLVVSVPASATDLATVLERGELVVLTSPHEGSVFSREVSSGEYEGFDHELMKAFANYLKVDLRIQKVAEFDELIPRLLAGEGDLIASSFSITDARRTLVDYSIPYFPVVVRVVTLKDSQLTSLESLRGKTGAVVPGSSLEEKMRAIPDVSIRYVDQYDEIYWVVEEGEADFAFADSTSALHQLDVHPELHPSFDLPGKDYYGYAMTPGSTLKPALDEFLYLMDRSALLLDIVGNVLGNKGIELFLIADRL